jgi:hypothetical protein
MSQLAKNRSNYEAQASVRLRRVAQVCDSHQCCACTLGTAIPELKVWLLAWVDHQAHKLLTMGRVAITRLSVRSSCCRAYSVVGRIASCTCCIALYDRSIQIACRFWWDQGRGHPCQGLGWGVELPPGTGAKACILRRTPRPGYARVRVCGPSHSLRRSQVTKIACGPSARRVAVGLDADVAGQPRN